jgi:hypothetical protein
MLLCDYAAMRLCCDATSLVLTPSSSTSNLDLLCGTDRHPSSPFALSGSSVGQRGIFAQTTQLLVPAKQTISVSYLDRSNWQFLGVFFGRGFHYRPGKAPRHPKTDLVSPRPMFPLTSGSGTTTQQLPFFVFFGGGGGLYVTGHLRCCAAPSAPFGSRGLSHGCPRKKGLPCGRPPASCVAVPAPHPWRTEGGGLRTGRGCAPRVLGVRQRAVGPLGQRAGSGVGGAGVDEGQARVSRYR